MDGISRTAGIGPFITLCGERFQVQGRILRHYCAIEAEIVKQRGNPLSLIREGVVALTGDGEADKLLADPSILQHMVSLAFDEAKRWRHIDQSDLANFLNNTWHGTCVTVWLAIRHNDPQRLTLDEVARRFSDEYEDRMRGDEDPEKGLANAEALKTEIFAAVDQAGGEDELGNSTGSSSGSTSQEETMKPTTDLSPGPQSSET